MFDLNFTWIEANCPKCSYIFEIQLVDVKNECEVYCHNCKSKIQLKDEGASTHKSVQDINKAIKDLDKIFKNLGK